MNLHHLRQTLWRYIGAGNGAGCVFVVLPMDSTVIYATCGALWSYCGSPEHFRASFDRVNP